MEYQTLENLLENIRTKLNKNDTKRRLAVAAAHEKHTLQAVKMAYEDNIIIPILIGDGDEIHRIMSEINFISPDAIIKDIPDADLAAAEAVRMIRQGEADFLMKGILNTANMLRAAVNREQGLTNGGLISHCTLAEISGYHKLIAYTDVGIVINPTLEQKVCILNNALKTMRAWGYEKPKVAVLTAVENVNPKMPETEDAAKLKQMALDGKFGECIIEGPISFDLTFDREIAKIKGFESPVVGNADILLVPNVVSGNIMAKTIMTFANMKSLALALGASSPMVITSRGTTIDGKYRSIIAAAGAVKTDKTIA